MMRDSPECERLYYTWYTTDEHHSDLTAARHPLVVHPRTSMVFAGRVKVILELDSDIQFFGRRL